MPKKKRRFSTREALKRVNATMDWGWIPSYIGNTTAYKQLSKPRFSKFGFERKSHPAKAEFVLEKFYAKLGKVANAPGLARNGYKVKATPSIDPKFEFAFELTEKSGKFVGRINFDPYFNRQGRPSIAIGNFQGYKKVEIEGFKQKMGATPLDFFLKAFNKAFPGQRRLVALNPKQHIYRQRLDDHVVANSMYGKGKLTESERNMFQLHLYGQLNAVAKITGQEPPSREKIQEIVSKVEAEKKRIISDGTGMHKAAYKKAGFKRNRSRMQRKKKE